MEEELYVIRKHKDTVFRMLFREKDKLLELYNALNGTDYENPEKLEVYTLENAIYLGVKNDVSFLLDSELNLYEQQASYNPNMPLRDLIYISRELEKYIKDKSLYTSSLVKIPVPRFVVFYNGTDKQPERQILKLSEAYEKKTEDPELELKVLMLNVNPGANSEIMEKSRTLQEYCEFVTRIRRYAKTEKINDAVEKAVTECIREGILSEFLLSQRAEVVSMSIFEYNEEEEMKKMRAAEFNYGKEQGKKEALRESILFLLSDKGEVSENIRMKISQEKELGILQKWLKEAATAESVEGFVKAAGLVE